MNENIDLTKILKDCPEGTKFWSPLYDVVQFCCSDASMSRILILLKNCVLEAVNSDATMTINNIKSPEIMLYPSKDQRDWNKFSAPWYKKERFDPKTLQSFDRVLVRDGRRGEWHCSIFSHISEGPYPYPYCTASGNYLRCIPYNDETKHLVGTIDESPEYYRYWEN